MAFHDAINRRDLHLLSGMMSEDHRFIDSGGNCVAGKTACVDAWRRFFAAFPDYANQVDEIVESADRVLMSGSSTCSDLRLAGPALWRATIRDGIVTCWEVFEGTYDNRSTIGLSA